MRKLVIALCVLWVVVAIAMSERPERKATVSIDGSSSAYPITEAVVEEFKASRRDAPNVTIGVSGTGGGFKRFCRGETDISQASRPITQEEIEACKAQGITFIELPIAFDAITIAVSKRNTTLECIRVSDLKKIWEPQAQGKIVRWNDVRKDWPDERLNLYGAGSDSGTFDYFTEAVTGTSKSSRGDYTASESDNVLITGIANDPFALGYVPYSYYSGNMSLLKAVAVDGGEGCVLPSLETAQNGTYKPLARPLFLYVNAMSARTDAVRDFIHFYLTTGSGLVAEVHYLPLPDTVYQKLQEHFDAGTTGTVFHGHSAIGASIHDIIAREGLE